MSEAALTTQELLERHRNPQNFHAGELVEVTGIGHRDFGKKGTIDKLFDIDNVTAHKPRAAIKVARDDGKQEFIFVSLPNLSRY
jgi:hypothetical protein